MWEEFLRRNITPPYISSVADITHRRLTPISIPYYSESPSANDDLVPNYFLILATDGLRDLYEDFDDEATLEAYVSSVANDISNGQLHADKRRARKENNLASLILKNALGGDDKEDLEAVSRMLTPQLDEQWLDDVTIIVQII